MDSYDWSNGIRYHMFDTRPDTEINISFRAMILRATSLSTLTLIRSRRSDGVMMFGGVDNLDGTAFEQ